MKKRFLTLALALVVTGNALAVRQGGTAVQRAAARCAAAQALARAQAQPQLQAQQAAQLQAHIAAQIPAQAVAAQEDEDDFGCPICAYPLGAPGTPDFTTACRHQFHEACIGEYLRPKVTLGEEVPCPLCREDLTVTQPAQTTRLFQLAEAAHQATQAAQQAAGAALCPVCAVPIPGEPRYGGACEIHPLHAYCLADWEGERGIPHDGIHCPVPDCPQHPTPEQLLHYIENLQNIEGL